MSKLNMDEVFAKIEKAAQAWSLTPKETNTLRLLGEEMVGMTASLARVDDLDFFVKSEEKNFELHLVAKASITPAQKREFVQASSHKQNQMSKGLKGKVKSIFEDFFYIDPDIAYNNVPYGYVVAPAGAYNVAVAWSMNEYINTAPLSEQKEAWDELEKSILINMADDIVIGASLGQVEMTVSKHFK